MNISAIILTYNEEIHIRRCIENLLSVAEKIFVIDCFSTDATINICKEYKQVHVIQHEWPGNQAEQFNWALNNCPVKIEYAVPVFFCNMRAMTILAKRMMRGVVK